MSLIRSVTYTQSCAGALSALPEAVSWEVSPHFALAGGVPDQLDDIFGMTQRQHQPMAAPPAHDDLLGAFQDSSLSSPSERFETPRSSPHPAVSAQQPSDDLLGGFEGSLGEYGGGLEALASHAPVKFSSCLRRPCSLHAQPHATRSQRAMPCFRCRGPQRCSISI